MAPAITARHTKPNAKPVTINFFVILCFVSLVLYLLFVCSRREGHKDMGTEEGSRTPQPIGHGTGTTPHALDCSDAPPGSVQ